MSRGIDVLVVDDRAVDADMTTLALRLAAPNAKSLRVPGGSEALEYLFAVGQFAWRSAPLPSLVLLDAEMPVVSGPCVLDVIRAHPHTSHVPVVMLCSNSQSRANRRQDAFAADAYIIRPLDFERYCSLIEAILNRWLPERALATRMEQRLHRRRGPRRAERRCGMRASFTGYEGWPLRQN